MASLYAKLQAGDNVIEGKHLDAVDLDFVGYDLRPFFSRFYDQTGGVSKEILRFMAEGGGEITLAALIEKTGISSNELSPRLAKLVQDGSIIRIDRGRYRLFHHLFVDYISKNR